MIEINGSAQRTFSFPAPRPLAYEYYSDFHRIVPFLPHISLIDQYAPHQFRLRYQATELGIYRVNIVADVQTVLDSTGHALSVTALAGQQPIADRASLTGATTQGYYTSHSLFTDRDGATVVDYRLQLRATFPTPNGLQLVPGSLLNQLAAGITRSRIQEILDAFIAQSIAAFPRWRAQQENGFGL
jgi:hypothetical protein